MHEQNKPGLSLLVKMNNSLPAYEYNINIQSCNVEEITWIVLLTKKCMKTQFSGSPVQKLDKKSPLMCDCVCVQ